MWKITFKNTFKVSLTSFSDINEQRLKLKNVSDVVLKQNVFFKEIRKSSRSWNKIHL